MPLKTYQPKAYGGSCMVTVTPTTFMLSVAARLCLALRRGAVNLGRIHWIRIHTDSDDRLIVFEPVPGVDKRPDLLKLGKSAKGHKDLSRRALFHRRPG